MVCFSILSHLVVHIIHYNLQVYRFYSAQRRNVFFFFTVIHETASQQDFVAGVGNATSIDVWNFVLLAFTDGYAPPRIVMGLRLRILMSWNMKIKITFY